MKSHEFQCAQCEEIKSNGTYVSEDRKVGEIICSACLEAAKSIYTKSAGPIHNTNISNPSRTLSSNVRQAAAKKVIEQAKSNWELFKQTYKHFDLSIQLQSTYISEDAIPTEITSLTPDQINEQVQQLTLKLNQLRSMAYHQARRKAFEQKIAFERHMSNLAEEQKRKKREKERLEVGRRLKGPAKKIYKLTGKLPNEFMAEFLQVVRQMDSDEKK